MKDVHELFTAIVQVRVERRCVMWVQGFQSVEEMREGTK